MIVALLQRANQMTLIAPPPAILSPPGIRPPEIHADRIVAAMVKHVIEVRAIFWETLADLAGRFVR
jgi:hypothetical protein